MGTFHSSRTHIYIHTVFFLKIPVMTLRMIQLEEEREKMDAVGRSVLIKGKE